MRNGQLLFASVQVRAAIIGGVVAGLASGLVVLLGVLLSARLSRQQERIKEIEVATMRFTMRLPCLLRYFTNTPPDTLGFEYGTPGWHSMNEVVSSMMQIETNCERAGRKYSRAFETIKSLAAVLQAAVERSTRGILLTEPELDRIRMHPFSRRSLGHVPTSSRSFYASRGTDSTRCRGLSRTARRGPFTGEKGGGMPTAEDELGLKDAVTSVSVTFAWDRPWSDQWWVALWWLNQVELCYKGRSEGPSDTSGWGLIVREACLAIYHVSDWLGSDPAVPLSSSRVSAQVTASKWLLLTPGVANTSKHRTVTIGKNPITAKVGNVAVRMIEGGLSAGVVTIDWCDAAGTTGNEDALDLVRGAIGEWRSIFGTLCM